jgi:hypothetical protein
MNIKRYVEMQHTESKEIVDIYGYENEVIVWTKGWVNTYPTNSLQQTKEQMLHIVCKLMDAAFEIINQEVRA